MDLKIIIQGSFMSSILTTFSRFPDFYSNSLIPENAILLRKLFVLNGELSQQKGWRNSFSSIVIPRIFTGFLTVPVALLESARISIQGLDTCARELFEGNYRQGGLALLKSSQNSLQCLILSVAYASLGLLFGSYIFTRFIPKPLKAPPEDPLKAENTKLHREIRKKNTTIRTMENLVKSQEQTLDRSCEVMRKIYAEKGAGLEAAYVTRNLHLDQLYKQKEANLEATYVTRNLYLEELYDIDKVDLEGLHSYKMQELKTHFDKMIRDLEKAYRLKVDKLETTYNSVMLEVIKRGLDCISQNENLQVRKRRGKETTTTTPSSPATPRRLSNVTSPPYTIRRARSTASCLALSPNSFL
jgi:hypothetical protein